MAARCVQCNSGVPLKGARCCSLSCAENFVPRGPSGDPALSWAKSLSEDGLDIVAAANDLLSLLEAVDRERPSLVQRDSIFLKAAISRYERLWLPLLAGQHAGAQHLLVPPLDVRWVWLLHRLAPCSYNDDCTKLYGKLLEQPVFPEEHKKSTLLDAEARTQVLWQAQAKLESGMAHPAEEDAWHMPQDERAAAKVAAVEVSLNRHVPYDLARSASAQGEFFYQTSRPQFRDANFLRYASQRYLRYLSIVPRRIERIVVPTYDVDLMWHAHMMYPQLYRKHCLQFVGWVVWHDDSLGQVEGCHEGGSPLDVCFRGTGAVYNWLFDDCYHLLECEYRGHDRPTDWHYENSVEQRVTIWNPRAVMVGSKKALAEGISQDSAVDHLDASDPKNRRLHALLRDYAHRSNKTRRCAQVSRCIAACKSMAKQIHVEVPHSLGRHCTRWRKAGGNFTDKRGALIRICPFLFLGLPMSWVLLRFLM